jgi:hypothetical protein
MQIYAERVIAYFNPQVENWKPELAIEEARHLANDAIILFPVTRETYGQGSLAECGFSITQALKFDEHRDIVILIEQMLDEPLMGSKEQARDSLRSRRLVVEHLKRLRLNSVYLVDTLPRMLDVSLALYEAAKIREPLAIFNPHNL